VKTTTPIEQIVGDLKAAIKAIGKHGKVVLVVVAPDDDGTMLHRVERSTMTQDDWERLMREVPRSQELFQGQKGGRR
jgi:hypothetical protein